MGERAHESYIRQSHLARPIGGEGDTDMSPNQLYGQSADDRHFDLVEGALHEATESADKGDLAGGGEAGARGNHVLFGDTAFEIGLGISLRKILRISSNSKSIPLCDFRPRFVF